MPRLVAAVQELSLARDLDTIIAVVRRAARELTGADGATFVLKEGNYCHYADEDAIAPLWKGQKFPMETCVSGWVMMNQQPAIIEDIYADPRIPADAYRPTFVKSLAIVPIRTEAPIGAIGNYWARPHSPGQQEIELLQALANTTSVAMENVRVYAELEERVRQRTAQLEAANRELEAFAYTVSHDLRAPLRAIDAFSKIVVQDYASHLPEDGVDLINRIIGAAGRMDRLIASLLKFSNVTRQSILKRPVAVTALVQDVLQELAEENKERQVEITLDPLPACMGDAILLKQVFVNLLSNAYKFTRHKSLARITIGSRTENGETIYFVRDNGAGFDMDSANRLFGVFQRLHSTDEFEGNGIGLSLVQRIIHRHGGRIWGEGKPNEGAAFHFVLGGAEDHLTYAENL